MSMSWKRDPRWIRLQAERRKIGLRWRVLAPALFGSRQSVTLRAPPARYREVVALALALCSVLLGFALGSVQPMILSTLHQITPTHRHGEALGLRMMTINGSSVIMPTLFGTLGTLIGISGVFWIVGSAVGIGSHTAWRLRKALGTEPMEKS